jgi:hypothetical protein
MAVSMLLLGNRLTLLSHVTSGLALSMFLVSSLGVLGRIAHLPFDFIKPTFLVVGTIAILTLTIQSRSSDQLFNPKSYAPISVALFILIITLGVIITFTNRIESDSFSYLAYLTNWQHSPRLSFGEVIFGSGALEPFRFWLAMFPMNQAFLANISNLHGILLMGYYLNPVLVAISLLALYNLYEDLLRSNRQAIMALLLHFTFLILMLENRQPGNVFFFRITEDKSFAAFALAPVFFLAVICCLESPTIRRGIFVLLSGWSLALIHPIILAYSIFIAGLYAALATLTNNNYKTLGIQLILLVLIIFPSASLRFPSLYGMEILAPFELEAALVEDPKMNPIGDRITYIESTPFYGFNPEKIQIKVLQRFLPTWMQFLLSWSYIWILALGFLWSLSKLKKQNNVIASFIIASSTLILLCAIPYTGWLVGYFVSARMLWRAPWLFPIGLVGVVLITDIYNIISSKLIDVSRRKTFTLNASFFSVLAVCIVVIGYFSYYLYRTKHDTLENLYAYKSVLEEQAAIGNYIETNIGQPSIFLASYDMMNYLPGISSKAKVVFFRGSIFTPHPVNQDDIDEVLSNNEDFSIQRRIKVLDRYHVQYLLIEDVSVQEYYAEYPQFFKWEKIGDYWLIEYRGSVEGQ